MFKLPAMYLVVELFAKVVEVCFNKPAVKIEIELQARV